MVRRRTYGSAQVAQQAHHHAAVGLLQQLPHADGGAGGRQQLDVLAPGVWAGMGSCGLGGKGSWVVGYRVGTARMARGVVVGYPRYSWGIGPGCVAGVGSRGWEVHWRDMERGTQVHGAGSAGLHPARSLRN